LILLRDMEAAVAAARYTEESQQQQRLLDPRDHNSHNSHNHIAYRNFVHSIKSPRTCIEYVRSLRIYMSWLSVYDNYDAMLQKDPRLIASDIIDYHIP
jgi:hypothetical protein